MLLLRWCDELLLFSLSSLNKIYIPPLVRVLRYMQMRAASSLSLSLPWFSFWCSLLWHIPSTDWKSSPTHLHDFTWTPNYECNQPVYYRVLLLTPWIFLWINTAHYTHMQNVLLKNQTIFNIFLSVVGLFVCCFSPVWSGVKMSSILYSERCRVQFISNSLKKNRVTWALTTR